MNCANIWGRSDNSGRLPRPAFYGFGSIDAAVSKFNTLTRYHRQLRGNLKKKKSLFKDIIQIKVDHPPSYPIFDK